jgi:hypothetical protein
LKKALENMHWVILQEDETSLVDEYEVPYEMDENTSLFDGLNHKAFTVCRSLWMDILGGKDRATHLEEKNVRKQSLH